MGISERQRGGVVSATSDLGMQRSQRRLSWKKKKRKKKRKKRRRIFRIGLLTGQRSLGIDPQMVREPFASWGLGMLCARLIFFGSGQRKDPQGSLGTPS